MPAVMKISSVYTEPFPNKMKVFFTFTAHHNIDLYHHKNNKKQIFGKLTVNKPLIKKL